MNARERFLEVALFGKPDKIPLAIGGVRPATKRSWVRQGFPQEVDRGRVPEYLGFREYTLNQAGITSNPWEGFDWKPKHSAVDLGPIPPFKHQIIRENGRYRVWVDSLGITQRGFLSDWKDGWDGFATRVFMEFPVKNRKDFVEMKKRYDPSSPERYPKDWASIARRHRKRDYPLSVGIRGPFWWTRDMVGLQKIMTGIYKDPELIQDIMNFCAEFHVEVLQKALDEVDVDYVIMNEDMGYKKGPMIGPRTLEEFMGPPYKVLVKFFRDQGVKVIGVDSDGNVEPLLPVWLKLGINLTTPCEVAADMDALKLGEKHPELIMIGGIDKRELAKRKEDIEREVMKRVPPLVKRRGYFPGVDHAVPPDISLENFKYLVSLLKEICGW